MQRTRSLRACFHCRAPQGPRGTPYAAGSVQSTHIIFYSKKYINAIANHTFCRFDKEVQDFLQDPKVRYLCTASCGQLN